MKCLSDVFIKDELEELGDKGEVLYPFMLVFPNKRRIYYLRNLEEKKKWIEAIKKTIGYTNLYEFYELSDFLGKGKYGVVRKAVHKRTKAEVAVKIIKKRELNLKDLELLRREIEVIKVLQHPSIIRFFDIFEDQDYI
jgi:serine/threonine protein kinase